MQAYCMKCRAKREMKDAKAPYVTKPFDIAKLKTEVKRVIVSAG